MTVRGLASVMDTEQFSELVGAVAMELWPVVKNVDPQVIADLVNHPARLRGKLKKIFPPAKPLVVFHSSVAVDYGITIEEAIGLDNCSRFNPYISSRSFPTRRKGKVILNVEFIHLNRSISTEGALRAIDGGEFRPAELHEVLPLGTDPSILEEFPVAVLGSVWQTPSGHRRVPGLDSDDYMEQILDLYTLDDKVWPAKWRFAVVRKD